MCILLYVHADTSDIRGVSVSSDSNGFVCFNVTQIPGSLLYGMVVQFVDTTSGNSIIRLAVVKDDKSVCIEDLPPGQYSISVGELNAPFLSIDEEVNVGAESTTITMTSSKKLLTMHCVIKVLYYMPYFRKLKTC